MIISRLFATLLLIIWIILTWPFPSKAGSHHLKPGHWYPTECCHEIDCRPVPCDQLEELANGSIRDMLNKQVYVWGQIRPSKDQRCHICTAGGLANSSPICVFILQGS